MQKRLTQEELPRAANMRMPRPKVPGPVWKVTFLVMTASVTVALFSLCVDSGPGLCSFV